MLGFLNQHIIVIFLALILISSAPLKAQTVVIENFGSIGCTDSVVNEENIGKILKNNDNVLVLSCHTRMGSEENAYSMKVCRDRKFKYLSSMPTTPSSTPFIMINGRYDTKGYYPKVVSSGAKLAAKENPLIPFEIQLNGRTLIASLPELENTEDMELYFFAYMKELHHGVEVSPHYHDEQGNEIDIPEILDIKFHNVVRVLKHLSAWSGNAETLEIPIKDSDYDGYAIIAQHKNLGPLVAAGYIEPTPQQTPIP